MPRQYVEITLDKPRRLRYDMNALADLEEQFGLGINEIFKEQRVGFRTVRAVVWAGLKWEEPRLTLERTGEILQGYLDAGGGLDEVMTAVGKALELSNTSGSKRAAEGNGNPEAAK